MKTVIISLFLLSCVSSKMYESKQTPYEGKWINVEYNQAIKDKKDFSELSKMSYNFLYFKNDKVSIAFRYEQISEPGRIKFSDKNRTTFDYLDFNFKYRSDSIFMKRGDEMIATFVKYD